MLAFTLSAVIFTGMYYPYATGGMGIPATSYIRSVNTTILEDVYNISSCRENLYPCNRQFEVTSARNKAAYILGIYNDTSTPHMCGESRTGWCLQNESIPTVVCRDGTEVRKHNLRCCHSYHIVSGYKDVIYEFTIDNVNYTHSMRIPLNSEPISPMSCHYNEGQLFLNTFDSTYDILTTSLWISIIITVVLYLIISMF